MKRHCAALALLLAAAAIPASACIDEGYDPLTGEQRRGLFEETASAHLDAPRAAPPAIR